MKKLIIILTLMSSNSQYIYSQAETLVGAGAVEPASSIALYKSFTALAAKYSTEITIGSTILGFIGDSKRQKELVKNQGRMMSFLQNLDRKLDYSIAQNKEILEKLDRLPKIIEAFTIRALKAHDLNRAHILMEGIEETIYLDNNFESYKRGSRSFINMMEQLHYLYADEYRMSHIPYLIVYSDLAIFASNNDTGIINNIIRKAEKISVDKFLPLLKKLKDETISKFNNLDSSVVSGKERGYITKHTVINTTKIEDMRINYTSDKETTKTIIVKEVIFVGHPDRERRKTILVEKQVADQEAINFNSDKNNAMNSNKNKIQDLLDSYKTLKEVEGEFLAFKTYLKALKERIKLLN